MLASLRATLPAGLDHEIIFVDDGSTDGTRQWLATLPGPAVQVVLNEKNLGYAAANNRGAALARGEFLALLNNDLVLMPRWLESMLAVFRQVPDAGPVGNVQRDIRSGAVEHSGIFINHKGKPENEKNAPRPGPEWRFADMVTGACLLVRRELWQQLGGFDQQYVNGCEDVDFCLRAKAAGFASVVALRSVVLHHVSASPGRKRRDEENAYRLILRWREQLVQLGLPAWCRKFIECDLNAATPPFAALSAFRYVAGWSRQAPAFAVAGMQAAIEIELSRWEKLVGPLA